MRIYCRAILSWKQVGCLIVMHRYDASWRSMISVASWMASMDVGMGGPLCNAGGTENVWNYWKLETKFLYISHFLFFVTGPPSSCRVGKHAGAMHRGNGASSLSQRNGSTRISVAPTAIWATESVTQSDPLSYSAFSSRTISEAICNSHSLKTL